MQLAEYTHQALTHMPPVASAGAVPCGNRREGSARCCDIGLLHTCILMQLHKYLSVTAANTHAF